MHRHFTPRQIVDTSLIGGCYLALGTMPLVAGVEVEPLGLLTFGLTVGSTWQKKHNLGE